MAMQKKSERRILFNKRRRKRRLRVAGILLLIISIAAGIFWYLNRPERKMENYLANSDYESAILLYNKKFAGTDQGEEYFTIFSECFETTVEAWSAQELDYQDAIPILEAMQKIKNITLAQKAEEMCHFILIEGEGNEHHAQAEEYFASGNYIYAMEAVEQINPEYSQMEPARELYELCKNTILEMVSDCADVESYEQNISKLEGYLELVDEPDFLKKMYELEKELLIWKDVVKIIGEAEILYDQCSYREAFSTLQAGIAKYPDHTKMKDSLQVLHDIYIVTITQQANTFCEKEDYDAALEVVDAAIAEYSCDEFEQLKESIKEQKNFFYKLVNDIKEKFTTLTSSWNLEEFDVETASLEAGSYILKSGEKIVLGDYSDEDVTVLSCTGNVVASIANLDAMFDIRDLTYDIQHWGEGEYFVARLAVDVVALLPVIGVVKYLSYTDDIADGAKIAGDVADQVADAGKTADKIADALATGKTADTIADALDDASDAAKVTDTVTDTAKASHYEYIKTPYQEYEGKIHPKSGIRYERQKIKYSNGKMIEGVFPIFKSKLDVQLTDDLLLSSAQTHKNFANKILKEKVESSKSFAKNFSETQLADILAGKTPNGYTWHHSEKEGVLQLVDSKTHALAKHQGGMSLWGQGY